MKFTSENAKEMQLKAAQKRKENTERRAILREILYEELQKPASMGSSETLAHYYVKKAMQNIVNSVTLEDLERMQKILGENWLKIKIEDARNPEDIAAEIMNGNGGEN